LPLLVTTNTADPLFDSTGVEISPSVDYKSISYLEFIPLLVQAFNEQNEVINTLVNQMQLFQERVPLSPDNEINRSSVNLSNAEIIILN